MAGSSLLAIVVAFLVNVPLSLLLLGLYRRALLREMRAEIGMSSLVSSPHQDRLVDTPSNTALSIFAVDADTPLAMSREAALHYAAASRSLRRAAMVSAIAGLLFALVISLGYTLTLGGQFYFVWFLWWVVAHAWPIPLAVGLVAGAVGRQWIVLAGVYVAILALLSVASLVFYYDLRVGTLVSDWLATVFVAAPVGALLYRRIRAVGLLVFVFTLMVFAAVPNVTYALVKTHIWLLSMANSWLLSVAGSDDRFWLVMVVAMVGIRAYSNPELVAYGTVILAVLFALAAASVLGWWTLKWIGRAYRTKRLNDQSLTLDALWASIALTHLTMLVSQEGGVGEKWAWIVAPIAAFGTYKLVQRWGFAVLCRPYFRSNSAPTLVLLRVFSLAKRSERLFDMLAPHWLRAGNIVMIAGPDLATGTVQPTHFLEFLAGRMRRQFVADEADLNRRLSELDMQPDPDGRYRVNQFFCFADTWQGVMRLMAQRASSIVMDLRSFSSSNQGCLYELEQLLTLVPLEQTLLIVDRTTDWSFLEATLCRLWTSIRQNSPNRSFPSSGLRVFCVQRTPSRDRSRIMQLLLGAYPSAAARTPRTN